MLLQDREENLLLFRQLKNIGVSIALDDFGIGYGRQAQSADFMRKSQLPENAPWFGLV
jgi:EAL domain-containing protein (putative c-di-GMP-specific phosphodiesterase class I)